MGNGFEIFFYPIGFEVVIELAILLILLIGTGMMSASEVAFFSLKPVQINELRNKKSINSILVLKLIENPEKLLANILIGNNFLNISIIILSSNISNQIFDFSRAPLFGFLFQVVIVTFLILLVGEIIPKVFASYNNIKVSMIMALQLEILSKIFYPITYLLLKSSSIVQKKIAAHKPNISIDDLSDALEITSASLKDEKRILEGIVKFGNTDVSSIMHPRLDIVAIENDISLSKVLSVIVDAEYSRMPVYEETLDNIKGILYAKDLLPYIHESNTFNWQALIKPAYFVPETKMIDDLLAEFQKKKTHLAVVVDEYGGTCGIVTMEDILEEIIGEISDESDVDEEQLFKKLSYNSYLFEAKLHLNDFFKITEIDDAFFDDIKGEYETLAGLFLELKGEIPQKGDKIDYKNITFIVESVDKRRIKQMKVIIN